MFKVEQYLLSEVERFHTPASAVEWLIKSGFVDPKQCRIWAIRKHYFGLLKKDIKKMDAITITAVVFCVSESTVQDAIYRKNSC